MANPTVSSITPRAIVEVCARHGVDTSSTLAEAGLCATTFQQPDLRIPFASAKKLWAVAEKHTRDEAIGLHTAETLPFGAYRTIDYILTTAATPRDGLRCVSRYFQLLNGALELRVVPLPDAFAFEIHATDETGETPRHYVEFIFASAVQRYRLVTGTNWKPREVHLTAAAPHSLTEHTRFFQAPLRFRRQVNRMIVEPELMNLPQPNYDPVLSELLEHHAQRQLQCLYVESGFLHELRRVLCTRLRGGDASLPVTARALGLSRRSLQRKLNAQGLSYRAVLDGVRRDLATTLLMQPDHDAEAIADGLGFSETSSFYRAFKRWTGQTPQSYNRAAKFGANS